MDLKLSDELLELEDSRLWTLVLADFLSPFSTLAVKVRANELEADELPDVLSESLCRLLSVATAVDVDGSSC